MDEISEAFPSINFTNNPFARLDHQQESKFNFLEVPNFNQRAP